MISLSTAETPPRTPSPGPTWTILGTLGDGVDVTGGRDRSRTLRSEIVTGPRIAAVFIVLKFDRGDAELSSYVTVTRATGWCSDTEEPISATGVRVYAAQARRADRVRRRWSRGRLIRSPETGSAGTAPSSRGGRRLECRRGAAPHLHCVIIRSPRLTFGLGGAVWQPSVRGLVAKRQPLVACAGGAAAASRAR